MKMLHRVSRRTAAALAAAVIGLGGALHADTVVSSVPVGVMSRSLDAGTSGLAFPLIHEDAFVGIVAANTDDTLVFTDTAGDVGAAIHAQGRWYAEVATGPLEGERFDIDTAATLAAGDGTLVLSFGSGSHSTVPTLGADALAGSRVIVRPHVTLSDLPSMFAQSLAGDNKHNKADGVQVYEASGYAFYFLHSNGLDWGKKGAAGKFGGLVLPPDTSIQVVLRSAPKGWLHEGVVRSNAFRKNLAAGTQAFATGFPVALSPVDLGAFANVGVPAETQWKGDADPELADGIQLSALIPPAFNRYFLDADGLTWRRVAQKPDVTDKPFAGPTDAMLLLRNNPDPDYLILRPFDN